MKRIALALTVLLGCTIGAFAADNLVTARSGDLESVLINTKAKEFTVKIASDGTWVIEYNDSISQKAEAAARSAYERAKSLGQSAYDYLMKD